MTRIGYLVMLLFTATGSWWIEWGFKVRVLRRLRFTLTTIAPISFFFLLWDWLAINQGHWRFDSEQMLGTSGPLGIPLEEYLFFIVIPLAIILTYEGLSRLRPQWRDKYQEVSDKR